MSTAAEHDGTEVGTVYMVHFDTPYKHARHYTGWAKDLDARLQAHREGRGARLMEVIKEAGITWRLARTWPGGRDRERAIKDRHEAPKLCPECSPQPRPVAAGRSAATAGTSHQAQAGQLARPPSTAPEPAPGGALPAVWPGRPDEAAARKGYRGLRDVADNLISGWHEARPAGAEPAEAEVGE